MKTGTVKEKAFGWKQFNMALPKTKTIAENFVVAFTPSDKPGCVNTTWQDLRYNYDKEARLAVFGYDLPGEIGTSKDHKLSQGDKLGTLRYQLNHLDHIKVNASDANTDNTAQLECGKATVSQANTWKLSSLDIDFLKRALAFAGKDDNRYFLNGILISKKGFMAASNGHALFKAPCSIRPKRDIIVSRTTMECFTSLQPRTSSAPVYFSINDMYISLTIKSNRWAIKSSLIDGEYPKLSSIINQPKVYITFPVIAQAKIKNFKPISDHLLGFFLESGIAHTEINLMNEFEQHGSTDTSPAVSAKRTVKSRLTNLELFLNAQYYGWLAQENPLKEKGLMRIGVSPTDSNANAIYMKTTDGALILLMSLRLNRSKKEGA